MITLTVDGIDQSCKAHYELDISVGRTDVYSQPDGSVLGARFIGWAPAGKVGSRVRVTDSELGVLFAGIITDITAEFDDTLQWEASITAVGPLAALGHMLAGYAAYPQETDSQRVARTLAETPLGTFSYVDTSVAGPELAARADTAEPTNAAELARLAADSGRGVLWEWPADLAQPIRYTPAKYRSWDEYAPSWGELEDGAWDALPDGMTWDSFDSDAIVVPGVPPALELDPCAVFASLTFTQSVGDIARTVKVEYGDPDAESKPAPVITGTANPTKTFTTNLATISEAESYAETMLDRMAQPSWRLDTCVVEAHLMSPAAQVELRQALQIGARVTIPLPLGSPVGTVWQGFLEGYDETLLPQSHQINLRISDRFLTEAADRWTDIPAAAHWLDAPDNVAWQDTTNIADAAREWIAA